MNRKDLLAKRMKARMGILGINAAELSRRSGVSESAISRGVTGTSIPSRTNLEKIAKALEMTVDDLTMVSEIDQNRSLQSMMQLLDENLPRYSDRERMELARFILRPTEEENEKTE